MRSIHSPSNPFDRPTSPSSASDTAGSSIPNSGPNSPKESIEESGETPNAFVAAWTRARTVTATNLEITRDVLEAVRAYRAGEIPFDVCHGIARGYDLFVAVNQLEIGSDDRQAVIDFAAECERRHSKPHFTTNGVYYAKDLDDAGAIIGPDKIVLPIAHEWAVKPTATSAGQRGAFVYEKQ